MKVWKKIAGIVLATTLAVTGLTGCGEKKTSSAADANGVTTLRVGVSTASFDHFINVIGVESGIFKKHNLNVEYTEFSNGIHAIDGIATDSVDIAGATEYASLNRMGNTLNESGLIIFSGLNGGYSGGGIYVAPEYANNIKGLEGSAGFIVLTGAVSEYNTTLCIKYLGLDESKVNKVNTDSHTTGLAIANEGGATAVWANANAAKKYKELGWVEVASAKQANLTSSLILLAKDSFYTGNEAAMANYIKALKEIFDYVNDNEDKAAQIIESKLNVEQSTFKTTWNDTNCRLGLSDDSLGVLSDIESWLYKNGKIPTDFDVKNYIRTSAIKQAVPDNVSSKLN